MSVGFGQKLDLKVVFNLIFKSLSERSVLDQDRLESKQTQKIEIVGKYYVKSYTFTYLISPNFACYDFVMMSSPLPIKISTKQINTIVNFVCFCWLESYLLYVRSISTCCLIVLILYFNGVISIDSWSSHSRIENVENWTLLLLLCSELHLGFFTMSGIF